MRSPRGATSSWNLGEGETWVYEACAPSVFKQAGGPSVPMPQSSSLFCHRSQGRTQAAVFCRDGLARVREGLLIFLVSNQLSSLQTPWGKDLQQHVFLLPLPASAPSPFPPPTAPGQYQPCSSSLPVASASLPALPSGSQLSSSEQGSRQGWEGRTVTRYSCWLLLAALRVAPSDQQQSGLRTGRMAGRRALVSPREVSTNSPGVTFCKQTRPI